MAESNLPGRPAPLPVSKNCFYKTVKDVAIPIDVYLPSTVVSSPAPIMLFIHGGGWIAGEKLDYPRATFHRFLSLGFIVTSMDYRLIPETPLSGLLEDIRDVELWLRTKLSLELKDESVKTDGERIVVVGASAGAHLALLTVLQPDHFFWYAQSSPFTSPNCSPPLLLQFSLSTDQQTCFTSPT